MNPDGETQDSAEPGGPEERIAQLEAELDQAKNKELDYQILTDAANNLLVVARRAGPLVVQEAWDPVFAKQFAEGILAQLEVLAKDRKEFEAQMAKVRRDQGPGGPKLWTPGAEGPPPGMAHPGMNRATRRAAAHS